jgi:hypothetical protein
MRPPNDQFVIIDESTIEKTYGWIIFYESKRFLDTGRMSSKLAGNGPVIVNKVDGSVAFFGGSESLSAIIKNYESSL